MSDIQRYGAFVDPETFGMSIEKAKDGDLVYFTDHEAALAKERERERAEAAVETVLGRVRGKLEGIAVAEAFNPRYGPDQAYTDGWSAFEKKAFAALASLGKDGEAPDA